MSMKARPIEEIREVHGGDHAHAAERAARDQRPRAKDRSVEAMAMPDNHVHAGATHSVDHGAALRKGERHGLFDQDVFAMSCSYCDVLDMELMRSRNIDRLHRGIVAKLLDRSVGACAEIGGEPLARVRPRIDGSDELQAGMMGERWQHEHEGAADRGNP